MKREELIGTITRHYGTPEKGESVMFSNALSDLKKALSDSEFGPRSIDDMRGTIYYMASGYRHVLD